MGRAVDEDGALQIGYCVANFMYSLCMCEGWEYAVEAGLGAWVPYERNIHLSRRRRWVRLRLRDKNSKAIEKKRVRTLRSSDQEALSSS